MIVNYYATLRQIVGQKSVDIDIDEGATVHQLLEEMIHRYPGLRRELLNEDGQLYQHVHIFINGRDVPYLENYLDTLLKAGDSVNVFPAVGGG